MCAVKIYDPVRSKLYFWYQKYFSWKCNIHHRFKPTLNLELLTIRMFLPHQGNFVNDKIHSWQHTPSIVEAPNIPRLEIPHALLLVRNWFIRRTRYIFFNPRTSYQQTTTNELPFPNIGMSINGGISKFHNQAYIGHRPTLLVFHHQASNHWCLKIHILLLLDMILLSWSTVIFLYLQW